MVTSNTRWSSVNVSRKFIDLRYMDTSAILINKVHWIRNRTQLIIECSCASLVGMSAGVGCAYWSGVHIPM